LVYWYRHEEGSLVVNIYIVEFWVWGDLALVVAIVSIPADSTDLQKGSGVSLGHDILLLLCVLTKDEMAMLVVLGFSNLKLLQAQFMHDLLLS
jgi:hypothetical protein